MSSEGFFYFHKLQIGKNAAQFVVDVIQFPALYLESRFTRRMNAGFCEIDSPLLEVSLADFDVLVDQPVNSINVWQLVAIASR